MPRLLKVADMCSSALSDPANRLRKIRKKKSSAVPLFRSGHMSAICARLGSKGKVGVQRGRETAGVPSFLPPPQGAARSRRPQAANPPAEVQRKTPRPLGANTPAAVRVPRWVGAEKGAAPSGRTRSAGAEKAAAPFGRTACAVRVPRLTLRSYLTILRRQSMLSQQQNRRKYEPVHPCTLRSVPRH